jgi:hypothetical protein
MSGTDARSLGRLSPILLKKDFEGVDRAILISRMAPDAQYRFKNRRADSIVAHSLIVADFFNSIDPKRTHTEDA